MKKKELKTDRQRFEEYQELLGTAAHDLRGSIFLIKEYLSLLLSGKRGSFSEPQQAIFRKIEMFCERTLEQINSFQDLLTLKASSLVLKRKAPLRSPR